MGAAEQVAESTNAQMRKISEDAVKWAIKTIKLLYSGAKAAKKKIEKISRELYEYKDRINNAKNPDREAEKCLKEQARLTKNQLTIARENGGLNDKEYKTLMTRVDTLSCYDGNVENAMGQIAAMDFLEEDVMEMNFNFSQTKDVKAYENIMKSADKVTSLTAADRNEKMRDVMKNNPELAGKYDKMQKKKKLAQKKLSKNVKENVKYVKKTKKTVKSRDSGFERVR